jgi:hypothetical protein
LSYGTAIIDIKNLKGGALMDSHPLDKTKLPEGLIVISISEPFPFF